MRLDLISTHEVNISGIEDMTVMKETGLNILSTGGGSLLQLSPQEGRLVKKEIKHPCAHRVSVHLLCIQVAGSEYLTGADAGFPVGGGADPLGGRQHTILLNFPKNCMKSRKFWAVGGGAPGAPPLNPPLSRCIMLDVSKH